MRILCYELKPNSATTITFLFATALLQCYWETNFCNSTQASQLRVPNSYTIDFGAHRASAFSLIWPCYSINRSANDTASLISRNLVKHNGFRKLNLLGRGKHGHGGCAIVFSVS